MLLTFDPGGDSDLGALRSATGAVALDVTRAAPFARMLDEIPGRSRFESDRAFGAYRGHRVSVPFVATFDYVLDDRVALAALGDGVLDRIAAGATPAPPPLLALDVRPPGLSPMAWQWLLAQARVPDRKRVVDRLMGLAEGHLAVTLDRDALVIEASGNRR